MFCAYTRRRCRAAFDAHPSEVKGAQIRDLRAAAAGGQQLGAGARSTRRPARACPTSSSCRRWRAAVVGFRYIVQRLDPGQLPALQQLEGGAAARRQVVHVVGEAELRQRRGGVPAAHDRRPGRDRHSLRQRARARGERLELEGPHRPVPEDRAGAGDLLAECLRGPWANVEPHPAVGHVGRRPGRGARRARRSGRPARGPAAAAARSRDDLALSSARARQLHSLLLHQRVTGGLALRAEEAEAHRAADQDRVGRVEEPVDQRDLVAHLGPAEHHHERPLGRLDDERSVVTSRSRSSPATAGAAARPRPTVEACARWASPKASFTYTSASAASSSPGRGRSSSRPAPSECSRAPAPARLEPFRAARATSGPITSGAWCTGASISSPQPVGGGRPARSRGRGPSAGPGASRGSAARPRPEQQLDRGQRRRGSARRPLPGRPPAAR